MKRLFLITLLLIVGCSKYVDYGTWNQNNGDRFIIYKEPSGIFIDVITSMTNPYDPYEEYNKLYGGGEYSSKTYELVNPWFGENYFTKEIRIKGGKTELKKIYVKFINNNEILISDIKYFKNVEIKDGISTSCYENGQKHEEYIYSYGEGILSNAWTSNGIQMVKNGTGQYKHWHKDNVNGQIQNQIDYKNGKIHGLWINYYENGVKGHEWTYKDNKPDGLHTSWHENGVKWTDWTYKDGKEDGLWTAWYENGQKRSERTYKDGKEDGLWTAWYDNGVKWTERTYKDGKEDGLWTAWYDNGQKMTKWNYKDGIEDGLWTAWYENGQKSYKTTWKDWKNISLICWDEDGNECECREEWWNGCK